MPISNDVGTLSATEYVGTKTPSPQVGKSPSGKQVQATATSESSALTQQGADDEQQSYAVEMVDRKISQGMTAPGAISHRYGYGQRYERGTALPARLNGVDEGTCHGTTLAWLRNLESRDDGLKSMPSGLNAELLQFRLYHQGATDKPLLTESEALALELGNQALSDDESIDHALFYDGVFREMREAYFKEGFEQVEQVGLLDADALKDKLEEYSELPGRHSFLLFTHNHVVGISIEGDNIDLLNSARGYEQVNLHTAEGRLALNRFLETAMDDADQDKLGVIKVAYHGTALGSEPDPIDPDTLAKLPASYQEKELATLEALGERNCFQVERLCDSYREEVGVHHLLLNVEDLWVDITINVAVQQDEDGDEEHQAGCTIHLVGLNEDDIELDKLDDVGDILLELFDGNDFNVFKIDYKKSASDHDQAPKPWYPSSQAIKG